MTARHYIIVTTLVFLTLSSVTLVFNYRIDPYLIFGSPRTEGLNMIKVDINKHAQTSKAHYPYLGEWDTLLIGNSRAEMGLDPQHRCFRETGASAFNLGLPGARLRQQLEFALNMIYQQPIERVFLSVDFDDFLVRVGKEQSPKSDERETARNLRYRFDGSTNPDYSWNVALDRYKALFSLDALFSSVRTVALQSPHRPDRDEFGFNPALDFERAVAVEGAGALFAQKLQTLDTKYSDRWRLNYDDGSLPRGYSALNEFLVIASRENIDVIVFTGPFHSDYWSLMKRKGLFEYYDQWLETITALLHDSDGDPVFWDFSTDSNYVHEKIPRAALTTDPLEWFWEPIHYRRELGDLMLDTMMAGECRSDWHFGRRIRKP